MSYVADMEYGASFAAEASSDARAGFIRKTYAHLLGAVLSFAVLEAVLLQTPLPMAMMSMLATTPYSWLIVLVAFIGVSWVAEKWAQSSTSLSTQYMGLGLYVLAEAVIFLPLLYIATNLGGPGVLTTAALMTAVLFGGMTLVVFMTGADFSFLRTGLYVAGLLALGLIVCSVIFGFSLGIFFTVGMIGFACAFILYDTSKVLHHYRIGQHVAASLALFASLALLFWYVLRLVLAFSSDD